MPAKSNPFSTFWSGKVIGLPETHPCSLPQAMMLPENVTAPMRVDRAIVTPEVASSAAPSLMVRANSAPATAAEAPPPRPLNTATSSGMAVIWILRARNAPRTAPTAMETPTVVQSRIWCSRSVATIAISMASDERALPFRAVAGEPSCLMPLTKRKAESRYAS